MSTFKGNGESEKNLGRVLQNLKPANVAVGTKVRPAAERRLWRHCQPCGECPTVSTASKNKWLRPQRV